MSQVANCDLLLLADNIECVATVSRVLNVVEHSQMVATQVISAVNDIWVIGGGLSPVVGGQQQLIVNRR